MLNLHAFCSSTIFLYLTSPESARSVAIRGERPQRTSAKSIARRSGSYSESKGQLTNTLSANASPAKAMAYFDAALGCGEIRRATLPSGLCTMTSIAPGVAILTA